MMLKDMFKEELIDMMPKCPVLNMQNG